MKKWLATIVLATAMVFGLSGCSTKTDAEPRDLSQLQEYEKNGFLATKWCIENGYFSECRLESYLCGYGECWRDYEVGDEIVMELALYVQAERTYYNVEISDEIALHEIEALGFNRNDVTLRGYFDEDTKTIIATDFDAPPPPADEFYKGCL